MNINHPWGLCMNNFGVLRSMGHHRNPKTTPSNKNYNNNTNQNGRCGNCTKIK